MNLLFPIRLACCASLLLSMSTRGVVAQEQGQLGPAPQLRADAMLEQLEPQPPSATNVSIDPNNRSQVALAYTNLYVAQASVAIGWNGSVANCTPGTTSAAYRQATIDRVNLYRALAGLPGNIALFGGTQATNTQAAALIFSANHDLSHAPPSNWACWSQAGYSGADNSNVALSYGSNIGAGPAAVDTYIDDDGVYNTSVGHRRWVLYPPQVKMDSGSIPYGAQYAANALWISGPYGTRPATPNGVAWPSRGYVPWQLLPFVSNRWSFSWNGANFANARVSMTRNGVPLGAPTYETLENGYGDNTLVWLPQGVTYARPGSDVTYHVVVSGITGGGAPSSIAYDVIVIDPFVLGDPIFSSGFD